MDDLSGLHLLQTLKPDDEAKGELVLPVNEQLVATLRRIRRSQHLRHALSQFWSDTHVRRLLALPARTLSPSSRAYLPMLVQIRRSNPKRAAEFFERILDRVDAQVGVDAEALTPAFERLVSLFNAAVPAELKKKLEDEGLPAEEKNRELFEFLAAFMSEFSRLLDDKPPLDPKAGSLMAVTAQTLASLVLPHARMLGLSIMWPLIRASLSVDARVKDRTGLSQAEVNEITRFLWEEDLTTALYGVAWCKHHIQHPSFVIFLPTTPAPEMICAVCDREMSQILTFVPKPELFSLMHAPGGLLPTALTQMCEEAEAHWAGGVMVGERELDLIVGTEEGELWMVVECKEHDLASQEARSVEARQTNVVNSQVIPQLVALRDRGFEPLYFVLATNQPGIEGFEEARDRVIEQFDERTDFSTSLMIPSIDDLDELPGLFPPHSEPEE